MFMQKFGFVGQARTVDSAPVNISVPVTLEARLETRLEFWKIYFKGSTESLKSFLFGHIDRPDISVIPSAHNYYLDLLYNFGFIALLPLLYLLIVTLKRFFQIHRHHVFQYDLIALSGLVLFFVLIDNSLKVGFRQPYSGIIMFFLWGVLLSRLSDVTNNNKIDL